MRSGGSPRQEGQRSPRPVHTDPAGHIPSTWLAPVRGLARNLLARQLGGELDISHLRTGDAGWFGPASVAWTVHADPALLIGGLSALLHQTLHPLTMSAVADHSGYENDPWGRLVRTARFLNDVVYGSTEVATRSISLVRSIHRGITGTAPNGMPYRADDPDLLAFVHATEVQGFVRAHRLLATPNRRLVDWATTTTGVECASDLDRYVSEMALVASSLGASPVPTDLASLEDELDRFRPVLYLGHQAERAARFLLDPPLETGLRPFYTLIADGAVALLGPSEAALLGLAARRRKVRRYGAPFLAAGALRALIGPAPAAYVSRLRTSSG